MRELPILMNGAMVRGRATPSKSAIPSSFRSLSNPMQGGMLTARMSCSPPIYGAGDRAEQQKGHHYDAKCKIDVLP